MTYPPQAGQEGHDPSGHRPGGPETSADNPAYSQLKPLVPAAAPPVIGNRTDLYAPPPGAAYPTTGYGYGGAPGYGPTQGYGPPPGYGYGPTPGYGYGPTAGYGYGPTPGYGYGAPYGYLGHYPAPAGPDGLAIASLVLSCFATAGLCAWGVGGLPFGITGAILGHVAKHRIRRSGASGSGLALAGIIVGWVAAGLGLVVAGVLVLIIFSDQPTNY